MTAIANNLRTVRARLAAAERESGRPAGAVMLLAVSKTWPAEYVRDAFEAGQQAFGENYVQEGVDKRAALAALPLEWHFIGPLQSNKTRLVAENFDWVHSIDRLKIAQRLSAQRDVHVSPLKVCVQVNVSGEETKAGVTPDALMPLLTGMLSLPGLQLRGLMCIPEPSQDAAILRARFALLRQLKDEAERHLGVELDTLSMGMSHDLEAAVAEGATMVRIGTAIFGPRELA